jgi:hypothetical protein
MEKKSLKRRGMKPTGGASVLNQALNNVLLSDSEDEDQEGVPNPINFLEESISMLERTSLKLYPVVREVLKRIIAET